MPNLRQLEYLVAIADTRHFRRAAERANTTQPTLSEQLKALEIRLGVQLVERSRPQAILTPIGAQVVVIARRMLADAEEIRSLAVSGGRELAGVMRLGLPPTIGPYLLPSVIPKLRQRFPKLKLYVREELPGSLVGALIEGRHDLIITTLPARGGDIVAEPLFRELLYIAVPQGHNLASKQSLQRADLAGQDILALGQGHQLHDVAIGLAEDFGGKVRFDYEGTSLDTLREMVAMGLGITFLPGLYLRAVAMRDENIKVMELVDRTLDRSVGLVWRNTSARHERYLELADLLRGIIAEAFTGFALVQPELKP